MDGSVSQTLSGQNNRRQWVIFRPLLRQIKSTLHVSIGRLLISQNGGNQGRFIAAPLVWTFWLSKVNEITQKADVRTQRFVYYTVFLQSLRGKQTNQHRATWPCQTASWAWTERAPSSPRPDRPAAWRDCPAGKRRHFLLRRTEEPAVGGQRGRHDWRRASYEVCLLLMFNKTRTRQAVSGSMLILDLISESIPPYWEENLQAKDSNKVMPLLLHRAEPGKRSQRWAKTLWPLTHDQDVQ